MIWSIARLTPVLSYFFPSVQLNVLYFRPERLFAFVGNFLQYVMKKKITHGTRACLHLSMTEISFH